MQNNSWQGTSYVIVNDESNRDLINFLQANHVKLEEENGKYIVYQNNNTTTIFNLHDYVNTREHFRDIEKYFSDIDFSRNINFIPYLRQPLFCRTVRICAATVPHDAQSL